MRTDAAGGANTYEHRAVFYEGDAGFATQIVPFVAAGVDRGQAVLAVVSPTRIALVRECLGERATGVQFLDVCRVGANPAHLIPTWRQFVEESAGDRGARGIGEPIWAGRDGPALLEAQRHEALLDQAFADRPPVAIWCPYDVTQLAPPVLEEARRAHDHRPHDRANPSPPDDVGVAPFDAPLEPAPRAARVVPITHADSLAHARAVVAAEATRAGLFGDRIEDAIVAVNELVANTIRHGGGRGSLRVWTSGDELLCEVADRGHIRDPLAGRRRPEKDQLGGRGLWLANQLCDLVEIRTRPGATVVRVHVQSGRAEPDG